MAGVGQPAREHPVVEGVGDLGGDDHAADGDVAGVDALGEGDQVGPDVVRVEREPLARTPEARHDLVEDQEDPVAVADLARAGEVAGRRDHDPRGPGDRLEQDGRDALGPLGLDRPLEVVERTGALLLGRTRPELRAVEEGPEEVHVAGRVLVGDAAPVARRDDGGAGVAVVRAVAREDLGPAGDQAGHPDGVLVGVGAAGREEDLLEALGRPLQDQPCRLRTGRVRRARGRPS